MANLFIVLLIILTLVRSEEDETFTPNSKIKLVWEINRHGARAPSSAIQGQPKILETFGVGKGMLTPQGMRQRYLLGRYNNLRFSKQYPFLDEQIHQDEVKIQSTNVYRTIQSAYSEMHGIFPEE